ncbi:oxygenase [Lithospermum erythrorhizon]|uniref:Squalene monooxygenase n=1 Tax=Lithospermum erythrorhizon TaxID=34254 RepID=A0AAV3NRL5_LITER
MTNYLKTQLHPRRQTSHFTPNYYTIWVCITAEVPTELHQAFLAAVEKGNVRRMTNRSMPAAPHPTPGALLLGDAFNMRHPLTGGGMTVALSDIAVLHNLLKPLRDLHDAPTLFRWGQ